MKSNSIYKQRKAQSEASLQTVMKHLESHGRTCTKATKQETKKDVFELWVDGVPVKWKMTNGDFDAIPFEVLNSGHDSWFRSSKAKLFFYYMEASRTLYVIDIDETRKYVRDTKPAKKSNGSFGGIYYLIPLRGLKMNGLVREVIYV